MSDTPLGDAVRKIPKNQIDLDVSKTQKDGLTGRVTFEKENKDGTIAGGGYAEESQENGWGVGAFFKWAFGGKK